MARKLKGEASLLKACTDLLSAERIWWMRMNVGAVRDGKRFVRFGKPGTADLLASPWTDVTVHGNPVSNLEAPEFLWIECKTAIGKMSRAQELFAEDVRENGHTYLLIRDVDELRNWLREHGAIGGIR